MIRPGLISVILVAAVLTVGCAKRPVTTIAAAPAPTGVSGSSGMTSTAPSQPPGPSAPPIAATQPPLAPPAQPAPKEFVAVPELEDIHFDFDKGAIRPGDAQILDRNVRWLKANERDLLLIEGHCDERGTDEYNLALGDRRAKATMNYLVAHGVAARRITTISYGKERPLCADHHEACWAKNRRVHFLVKRG